MQRFRNVDHRGLFEESEDDRPCCDHGKGKPDQQALPKNAIDQSTARKLTGYSGERADCQEQANASLGPPSDTR
jgi:hypothetical protein